MSYYEKCHIYISATYARLAWLSPRCAPIFNDVVEQLHNGNVCARFIIFLTGFKRCICHLARSGKFDLICILAVA